MATTGSFAGESLYGIGAADVFDSKGLATYEQGNGGGRAFIYDGSMALSGGNISLHLFDTGVGPDGAAFGLATADPNWILVDDAAGTVAYTTNYGSPWLGSDGISDFINPGDSAEPANEPSGIHTYQTTFTISDDINPSSLSISGQFAADNWVDAIVINGHTLALSNTGSYNSWTQFFLPSADLVAGANTIQFVSNNDGAGPTGLRVEFNPVTIAGYGSAAGDTFVYNTGYGQLTINEDDTSATPSNTLAFGAGIGPGDIQASTDGSSIFLVDGVKGDQVSLEMMASASSTGSGVQNISFAAGTIWSGSQLLFLANNGTTGNDTIQGTSGNDLLDGRGGVDQVSGGGGNDTYFFREGYGTLTIDNAAGTDTAAGQLDFGRGIQEQNLWLTQNGNNLILNVLGTSDAVTLANWFGPDASAQLSAIHLTDGKSLTTGVNQLLGTMESYQSSNPSFSIATATTAPSDTKLQTAVATDWA